MKVKRVFCNNSDTWLTEGCVDLVKGQHGWKLVITQKDGSSWKESTYVNFLHPLTNKEDEVVLVIYTDDDNWYFFDCVEGTANEAVKKFNKIVGLTW